MLKTTLPPCLIKILEDSELLRKHYPILLRYVSQKHPELFAEAVKTIIESGIHIQIGVESFMKFDCAQVPKDLCDESCPIRQDVWEWIKQNTTKVEKTFDGDESTILIVYIQEKPIKINLNNDNIGRSFVSQFAGYFNRIIDMDLRRKDDKCRWLELLEYWLSKAEPLPYEKYIEKTDEEDFALIQEVALDYIRHLPVYPKDEWVDRGAFSEDGEYGYVLKEEILKKVNSELRKNISMKMLTLCLRSCGIEVERKSIEGIRKYFYKFKLSDVQKKMYNEYLKKAKTDDQNEKGEGDSFEDYGFDIQEVL